ncbi:MAG: hypothetical protein MPEBLZ_02428 [Candidatus Methanoperedens nitroreducens]|uniref:Uncharacterized protein n=1 Tax=Candidatus Methanoperedens nitratireducens TaxID=1392998 RepID=A0A0P8AFC9_9EURY|nr:MAG: hypothetical protein MPEBLZ_02428 [Candidatus Methanoperedens sp. BLZ1]
MGFEEYIAAREFLGTIGQPVITYILIISLFQGIFSILYLIKKNSRYYDYLIKCLYISTGLYLTGFLMLAWFHVQIYDTVLIEYPAALRQMIPVENSRIAAPLWIESEKLYFWAMCASIFAMTVTKRKDIMSFLGVILSIFFRCCIFFLKSFQRPSSDSEW